MASSKEIGYIFVKIAKWMAVSLLLTFFVVITIIAVDDFPESFPWFILMGILVPGGIGAYLTREDWL